MAKKFGSAVDLETGTSTKNTKKKPKMKQGQVRSIQFELSDIPEFSRRGLENSFESQKMWDLGSHCILPSSIRAAWVYVRSARPAIGLLYSYPRYLYGVAKSYGVS
ncbi:uncharacterized protein LDX57_012136 [Aspergillus melleus]|uniref:uncharacterized protein n=1 Tax=Aspergillus melleus TaxID=138277 RepID=UPI001E8E5853|nr:uncharacterized protein LDX57_012136 [Aspergillus melleus]KAH8434491.1 hypothetical protein LDX57_012136 [Aspergillus melleus]